MSDNNDLLFEIKIKGKDFTSILCSLSDCSISCDTENKKTNKNFLNKIREYFYCEKDQKGKCKPNIQNKDGVKEIIENALIKEKNKRIIRKQKEIEDELKEKIRTLNSELSASYEEELEELQTDIEKLEYDLRRVSELHIPEIGKSEVIKVRGELLKSTRELLEMVGNESELENLILSLEDEEWDKEVNKRWYNNRLVSLYRIFSENINFSEQGDLIVGRRRERDFDLKEKDCKLFHSYRDIPQFGNLVGTIRKEYSSSEFVDIFKDCLGEDGELCEKIKGYKDKTIAITVQIRSRFDEDSSSPFFLLEMLTQGNIVFNNYSVQSSDEEMAFFDFFLLWRLKQYLMRAYQKGIYRSYQSFHENGMRLKGSIDFAQHIKLNMGLGDGRISYTYREKSVDNYLNHLILEAYQHLKVKYHDLVLSNIDGVFEVKGVIDLLKNETHYPKYSRSRIIKKCESPIIHPYYTEYEDLRLVCLRILRGEGASIMSSSGERVSGILYYIPDLWEEYLESRMFDLDVSLQEVINIFYGRDDFKNKIRPDFVFRNKDYKPIMILDAKYKPRWIDVHNKGNFQEYKSDYDECIRNMNAINAYATGVIFPNLRMEERESDDRIYMHTISEYNDITSFYTIPIFVPQPNKSKYKKSPKKLQRDFSEWQKKLNEAIRIKMEDLKKIIEIEGEKYSRLNKVIADVDLKDYKKARKENCFVLRS